MMAMDMVPKSAVGTATGMVGVASYLGAALQDLLSGQFIQAGKVSIAGQVHYDFTLAGSLWVGSAVLSCGVVMLLPRQSPHPTG